jgi:hypothetical protein
VVIIAGGAAQVAHETAQETVSRQRRSRQVIADEIRRRWRGSDIALRYVRRGRNCFEDQQRKIAAANAVPAGIDL